MIAIKKAVPKEYHSPTAILGGAVGGAAFLMIFLRMTSWSSALILAAGLLAVIGAWALTTFWPWQEPKFIDELRKKAEVDVAGKVIWLAGKTVLGFVLGKILLLVVPGPASLVIEAALVLSCIALVHAGPLVGTIFNFFWLCVAWASVWFGFGIDIFSADDRIFLFESWHNGMMISWVWPLAMIACGLTWFLGSFFGTMAFESWRRGERRRADEREQKDRLEKRRASRRKEREEQLVKTDDLLKLSQERLSASLEKVSRLASSSDSSSYENDRKLHLEAVKKMGSSIDMIVPTRADLELRRQLLVELGSMIERFAAFEAAGTFFDHFTKSEWVAFDRRVLALEPSSFSGLKIDGVIKSLHSYWTDLKSRNAHQPSGASIEIGSFVEAVGIAMRGAALDGIENPEQAGLSIAGVVIGLEDDDDDDDADDDDEGSELISIDGVFQSNRSGIYGGSDDENAVGGIEGGAEVYGVKEYNSYKPGGRFLPRAPSLEEQHLVTTSADTANAVSSDIDSSEAGESTEDRAEKALPAVTGQVEASKSETPETSDPRNDDVDEPVGSVSGGVDESEDRGASAVEQTEGEKTEGEKTEGQQSEGEAEGIKSSVDVAKSLATTINNRVAKGRATVSGLVVDEIAGDAQIDGSQQEGEDSLQTGTTATSNDDVAKSDSGDETQSTDGNPTTGQNDQNDNQSNSEEDLVSIERQKLAGKAGMGAPLTFAQLLRFAVLIPNVELFWKLIDTTEEQLGRDPYTAVIAAAQLAIFQNEVTDIIDDGDDDALFDLETDIVRLKGAPYGGDAVYERAMLKIDEIKERLNPPAPVAGDKAAKPAEDETNSGSNAKTDGEEPGSSNVSDGQVSDAERLLRGAIRVIRGKVGDEVIEIIGRELATVVDFAKMVGLPVDEVAEDFEAFDKLRQAYFAEIDLEKALDGDDRSAVEVAMMPQALILLRPEGSKLLSRARRWIEDASAEKGDGSFPFIPTETMSMESLKKGVLAKTLEVAQRKVKYAEEAAILQTGLKAKMDEIATGLNLVKMEAYRPMAVPVLLKAARDVLAMIDRLQALPENAVKSLVEHHLPYEIVPDGLPKAEALAAIYSKHQRLIDEYAEKPADVEKDPVHGDDDNAVDGEVDRLPVLNQDNIETGAVVISATVIAKEESQAGGALQAATIAVADVADASKTSLAAGVESQSKVAPAEAVSTSSRKASAGSLTSLGLDLDEMSIDVMAEAQKLFPMAAGEKGNRGLVVNHLASKSRLNMVKTELSQFNSRLVDYRDKDFFGFTSVIPMPNGLAAVDFITADDPMNIKFISDQKTFQFGNVRAPAVQFFKKRWKSPEINVVQGVSVMKFGTFIIMNEWSDEDAEVFADMMAKQDITHMGGIIPALSFTVEMSMKLMLRAQKMAAQS